MSTSNGPRATRSATSCGSCSWGSARSPPPPAKCCAAPNPTPPDDPGCTSDDPFNGAAARSGRPPTAGKVTRRYVPPTQARLAKARTWDDTNYVLAKSRQAVAGEALGHAITGYQAALTYSLRRKQFGRSLARFQLIQD